MKYYHAYETPVGKVWIAEEDGFITKILYRPCPAEGAEDRETPLIRETARQLTEYFAGERKTFNLAIRIEGTEFQRRCREALRTIPYGEVRSYKQQAETAGCPKGYRAVGLANSLNELNIVVPCHRVVGANGKLTGYGGGLPIKQALLDLEKKYR